MFSQRAEDDDYILPYFGDFVGRFLDIGAAEGKDKSNTHALALKGWSGVCVEPNPSMLVGLIETYRNNPNIQIVAAAVAESEDPLSLFHSSLEFLGSFDDAHRDKWAAQGSPFRDIWLPTITGLDLMKWMPYHLLNIDTEGRSVQTLEALPVELLAQARMVVIEHDERQSRIHDILDTYGLEKRGQTAENLIYAR